MQVQMTNEEVSTQLKQLQEKGESLNKKKVKQAHPELMQHALYYYPSWDHALKENHIQAP